VRVEVSSVELGRASLSAVLRSGKRPEALRVGDVVYRPPQSEGGVAEIVGYISAVRARALPQFYWLYALPSRTRLLRGETDTRLKCRRLIRR